MRKIRDKAIEWFVYMSGGIMAITAVCTVVGVMLEMIWGIDTLHGFYVVVAYLFIVSMILCVPCCVGGVYTIKKAKRSSGDRG